MSSTTVSRPLTSPRRVPSPARLLTARRRHMCGEILARMLSGTVYWSAQWVQYVSLQSVHYRGLSATLHRVTPGPKKFQRSLGLGFSRIVPNGLSVALDTLPMVHLVSVSPVTSAFAAP